VAQLLGVSRGEFRNLDKRPQQVCPRIRTTH
jgi:hypothetical protein